MKETTVGPLVLKSLQSYLMWCSRYSENSMP